MQAEGKVAEVGWWEVIPLQRGRYLILVRQVEARASAGQPVMKSGPAAVHVSSLASVVAWPQSEAAAHPVG